MLSIANVSSSSAATSYYELDDYYNSQNNQEHISQSQWYGEGAKRMGLEGNIKPEEFKKILEGYLSNGDQLGKQNGIGDIEHAAGIDCTFSAPKSVSIMSEVMGDKRIYKAHDKAVNTALNYIEKNLMQTRVKVTGEIHHEKVDNMIAAKFQHHESREQDPQLHTHVVIANAVQKDNGDWRSAYLKEIFNDKMYLGAMYRTELAANLRMLGYQINTVGNDSTFELEKVPNKIIKIFSKRSEQIKKVATDIGKHDAKTKAELALATRKNKESVPKEQLKEKWLNKYNQIATKKISIPKDKILNLRSAKPSKEAINYAIQHLSERSSVIKHKDIIKVASSNQMGKLRFSDLEKRLNTLITKGDILTAKNAKHQKFYTTHESLNREKETIDSMLSGQGSSYIISKNNKRALIAEKLNTSQIKAADHILTSKDRAIGIQGYAGTGKTFMVKAVKKIAEQKGYQLFGLAPSGSATKELQNSAKLESQTIHSFIAQNQKIIDGVGTQQGYKGLLKEYSNKIAIIDEASMVSTIQMASLEKISQKLNFKVVYLGDTKQLDAVEAGIPFHVMQDHGMKTIEMKDIIRQNENLQLKEAVYHSIEGSEHIQKAFNKVGDKNIIDLSKINSKAANNNQKISSLDIAEKVVEIYKNMSPSERSETLFTAQTHEVRLLINEGIRNILQNENKITGQPFSTSVLLNKSLTEIEKSYSYNYKKGDMVLFNGKITSLDIKKDSYYKVLNINSRKNILTLGHKNGDRIKLKTLSIEKFRKGVIEVYQKKDIKLQEKERIIFTRTIKDLKITNSDEAQITKIDSKQIHLKFKNGDQKSIDKNHLALKHLDYSYAVTNHKAQGKTYKNVVGAIESWRKNLTNQKSFYVTISRAKNKAIIVTDNKEKSIKQITNDTGKKVSSIEHQTYKEQNSVSKNNLQK